MKKEYRIAVAGTGYVGLSIAAPTNVYLKLSVRFDGLRWRIKLMQNTPTASLFYCRAR